ncbi:glycosyl transferase family protein [Parerythrobacter aurantius]|uniref:glycosyl transferase family protein n=1 Tax=Parerythrobacter aurantius TaxID=3127706 RepID=UPI003254BF00
MHFAGYTPGEWLLLAQYELLLFASLFFLIGAIDELAIDLLWLRLKRSGRIVTASLQPAGNATDRPRPLSGPAAVFLPAWQEDAVIGTTVRHMLEAWPQGDWTLYCGCYPNDPLTIASASGSSSGDPRVRVVVHSVPGPTTKADCLNRLYRALEEDERRHGRRYRMVLLHDAEDMVDPAALPMLDSAIDQADFVQLPVLPVVHPRSRWIAGHYCDEFAEAHGKAMPLRDAIGAGLPSAGVGCAIAREQLALLSAARGDGLPFDAGSLTEDYQLGLSIRRLGGRTRFLRVRHADGRLVATRAYFPGRLDEAVRQKTRWLHGIAFQGWERLGWSRSVAECWMRMRDRRGPFSALVLATAYLLVLLGALSLGLAATGMAPAIESSPLLTALLAVNFASLLWRAVMRAGFTAREYGWREGLRSVLRIPVANIISIMAGRRAVIAYVGSLAGGQVRWDKTEHRDHPVNPVQTVGQGPPA